MTAFVGLPVPETWIAPLVRPRPLGRMVDADVLLADVAFDAHDGGCGMTASARWREL
ncbi:MAG: hypothetical protein AAGF30_14130 [Pseudomonadota bacterium]